MTEPEPDQHSERFEAAKPTIPKLDPADAILIIPEKATTAEILEALNLYVGEAGHFRLISDAEWEQLETEREQRRIAELIHEAEFPKLQAHISMANYCDRPGVDRAAHEAATRWLEKVSG